MRVDPQAVFFDMDGTLLDWQIGMEESWRAACEAGCGDLPGITTDVLLAAVQQKRDWFWAHPVHKVEGRMDLDRATRIIVTEAAISLGIDAPEAAARIAVDYRTRRQADMRLYDGALDTLHHFRSRGVRLALITNGGAKSQRGSVERFGLAPYFDCVIIEGEFGTGKPDARVFHHALESCAANPDSAWMIGDNLEADIATPVRLGMHTVWVDEAGGGLPHGAVTTPHRIVRNVRELIETAR